MVNKIGLAVAALAASAGVHAARAANLSKGTYGVSVYYVSATPAGGGTCTIPAGTYLSAEYTYPGALKTGAVSRAYINSSGTQFILETTFPETPANGATSWSGSASSVFLPGGTAVTGTFSSTITVIDAKSFISKTTYVYPSATGSCTYVQQEVGILQ